MENLVVNILRANILAAVFIILVLVTGLVVKKRYSSKWRYLMWLVVGIFLLFPIPMVSEYAPIQIKIPQRTTEYVSKLPEASAVIQDELPEVLPEAESPQNVALGIKEIATIFVQIWFAGILIIGIYQMLAYFISQKMLMRWSVPQNDEYILYLYHQVCKKENIDKAPKLMQSKKLRSPVLVGLKNVSLYLPNEEYSEGELNLIFHHELTHYKKKDLWYKTFLSIVNTVYWFNPFLYLAKHEAQKDVEYLCDCTVVENRSKEDCILYSRLLVRTASEKGYIGCASASLNDGTATLKERIVYIMKKNRMKFGALPAVLCLTVLMAANVLVGCSVANTPKQNSPKVESENKNQFLDVDETEKISEKEVEALKKEINIVEQKAKELQKAAEDIEKIAEMLEDKEAEEQKRKAEVLQEQANDLQKKMEELEEMIAEKTK